MKAAYQVIATGGAAIVSGTISGLALNGVTIGLVEVKANDNDGSLVAAINAVKDTTGIEASVDSRGNLVLTSRDGRGIKLSGTGVDTVAGFAGAQVENYGRLSLTRLDGKDIRGISAANVGFSAAAEATVNLRNIRGSISADIASAMGFNANSNAENLTSDKTAGVTTLKGAMAVISIAETAQKMLDNVRSDLGSIQNQVVSTMNNISVTQVNVKAAESNIRDVDFSERWLENVTLEVLVLRLLLAYWMASEDVMPPFPGFTAGQFAWIGRVALAVLVEGDPSRGSKARQIVD